MKSQLVGLILAGKLNSCPLVRLRNLPEWLGPVKANTYRQASRFTNKHRAGYPVHDYSEVSSARTLLICSPADGLDAILDSLISIPMSWRRKTVIVGGNNVADSALGAIREQGATTGAITLLDEAPEQWYLAEGEPVAVRTLKRLIEPGGGRMTEVEKGSLEFCRAAASFATWLLLPAVDASIESLRKAGLSPRRAGPLVERLVERSLRGYLRSGRRSWKAPETLEMRANFAVQIEALRDADPQLGELLTEMARMSLRRMGQEDDWVPGSKPKVKSAAAGA